MLTLRSPTAPITKETYMHIARVRHEGKASAAIVEGSTAHLVRGGPFGSLERTGVAAAEGVAKLLVPSEPSKIVAIGINYQSHAGERTAPGQPEAFLKAPSSLIAAGGTIVLPPNAGRVDAEAEVVAIIGRRARNISEADVDDYVAGYTCGNDVSAREWQQSDLQWWRAKSSDTFTSVGPWMETGMDPENIHLIGRLNGEVVQEATTGELVHSIRKCIATISRSMTLERGDMVFTGTPGQTTQLRDGDVFEVEIEGIGRLRNHVANA
jgi:2-keto-4-pentenoate hydratase/2-oxohepta-3-ene-1,7-dioic acid hydratase in catechol pathway